ncbi:MAG TPA: hypothetical protein VEF91_07180 [Verrucomicrobiae bacterium]|nr:hypothetical protein [Verrucomicrobiae bacterium]
MRVYKPPPKRNTQYKIPAIINASDEGVVVEILRNHRLSEKDTDEERFFILVDSSILSLE